MEKFFHQAKWAALYIGMIAVLFMFCSVVLSISVMALSDLPESLRKAQCGYTGGHWTWEDVCESTNK